MIKNNGLLNISNGRRIFTNASLDNEPILATRPISLCPMFGKSLHGQNSRLYYTFLQTFYRPFRMNDVNERKIADDLFKKIGELVLFDVPDEKIYQFLHMRINQLYHPTYTLKQEFAFTNFNDFNEITSKLGIKSLVDFGTCEHTQTLAKMLGLQKSICMTSPQPSVFTFTEIPSDSVIEKIGNDVDLVTSLTSLHSLLPSRRLDVIRECYRIVKNGGYFLVCEHDINEQDVDATLFLDMYYNLREMVWARNRDLQRTNYYQTKEQWTSLIEQVGFKRVKNKFETKYNQLQKLYNGQEIQNPYYTYYALYQKIQ